MKQQVEDELRRREQEAKVNVVAPDKPSVAVAVNDSSTTAARPKVKRASQPASTLAQQKPRAVPDKAQESRQEARQQLAELVQTSKEDDGLPRLSDLIDDSNDAQ